MGGGEAPLPGIQHRQQKLRFRRTFKRSDGLEVSTVRGLAISLSQAQADSLTAAGPYMFPALHFDGGAGDGIYDVHMKLRRA
jgi:hypothetical protein